jgi:signal transduction histidine kinase
MLGDETRSDPESTAISVPPDGDARFESIIARLPHGLVIIDRELRVDYINPAARELLGGMRAPRRGDRLSEITGDGPLRALAHDMFRAGAPTASRLVQIEDRMVMFSALGAFESETGILLLEDVTERERVRLAERRLVENAAHELQTPLAAIVSVIEVLESGAKDTPHARDRFLRHLRSHSDRLARLATSLLALARIQAGQQEPHLELVHVAPLLERVAADLRPRPGVKVSVQAPHGIATLTDADLLHQILVNVAANAAKNTYTGEIVLEARAKDAVTELEIRDTGLGMSSADRDHVFERFYRSAESRSPGFGLGLSIAKEAVEALGGEIVLESELDKGTRVLIRLPVARIVS